MRFTSFLCCGSLVFLSSSSPSSPPVVVEGFNMVMMARRGKGNLNRNLDEILIGREKNPSSSIGQEITGVTLPNEGTIKGWQFGQGLRLASCMVDGQLYALQGECPRCGFELYRGTLLVKDEAWDDLPRIACPTCATTYSMRNGVHGPPLKRTGLQGLVTGLAKSATSAEAYRDAKVYHITTDDEGRVYCKF